MTRKDKISKAAQNYSDSMDEFQRYHTHPQTHPRNAFIDGAKWADDNPKEDLISIEKAKIWVRNAFAEYFGNELANNIADEFVKSIKK